jgi:hypothetical protein
MTYHIVRPAHTKHDYRLVFSLKSSRGLGRSFPCNAFGVVNTSALAPELQSALAELRSDPRYRYPYVTETTKRYPPILECACGAQFPLSPNGCMICPACGHNHTFHEEASA